MLNNADLLSKKWRLQNLQKKRLLLLRKYFDEGQMKTFNIYYMEYSDQKKLHKLNYKIERVRAEFEYEKAILDAKISYRENILDVKATEARKYNV